MAAEAEHREGDQGVGGAKAEGDAGERADLGVDRLDEGVREPVVERGVDACLGGADAFGEVHEGGNATAPGPGQPALEGVFAGLAFDGEDVEGNLLPRNATPKSALDFFRLY